MLRHAGVCHPLQVGHKGSLATHVCDILWATHCRSLHMLCHQCVCHPLQVRVKKVVKPVENPPQVRGQALSFSGEHDNFPAASQRRLCSWRLAGRGLGFTQLCSARPCHRGDCNPLPSYRSPLPSALMSAGPVASSQSCVGLGTQVPAIRGSIGATRPGTFQATKVHSSSGHHHLKDWLTWRDSSLREDKISLAPCCANSRASSSPRPWEALVSQTTYW